LLRQQPGLQFYWIIFSAEGKRRTEARNSARQFLRGAEYKIQLYHFRESYFPAQWASIKDAIEKLKSHFNPDLIFTHYHRDRHQDHSALSDLTWNAFRNHLILEYEVPKYEGDLGQPNLFIKLDETACRAKVDLIYQSFSSQRAKHWFSKEVFYGLMRIRGVECTSNYAEAFYSRKMTLF
jgi:LmbE family N-acetylglucosaminyl deacetylase